MGILKIKLIKERKKYDGLKFHIMHGDIPQLDGKYAAFGKMLEGESTLDAIADTPVSVNPQTGEKSVPDVEVVIKKITVLSK